MKEFRLVDFKVYDEYISEEDDEYEQPEEIETIDKKYTQKYENSRFIIQLFGIDDNSNDYCVIIDDFRPYFYIKIDNNWGKSTVKSFIYNIKEKIGKYYSKSIVHYEVVYKHTLYGFDNYKKHKFIKIYFKSYSTYRKLKSLFQQYVDGTMKLKPYIFRNNECNIYEANIPPLLRFFHERELSPSGWVQVVDEDDANEPDEFTSHCKYECVCSYKSIKPLDKEVGVPYNICSFDIEASSSHGDFPVPIKNYKKLSTELVEHYDDDESFEFWLERMLYQAFGFEDNTIINRVYPKKSITQVELDTKIKKLLSLKKIFTSKMVSYEDKINKIMIELDNTLPKLEGDKVTYIGTTFWRIGETKPYYQSCVVLGTCSSVEGCDIIPCKNEKRLLLKWVDIIQEQNPDFMIGYNIFGFDYKFLYQRALENNCEEKFLMFSKIQDEVCGKKDKDTNKYKLEESSITIASGTHNLSYVKTPGRIQLDLYNYFRRSYNLVSYKLDYVSGYFIGDKVKSIDISNKTTKVYSKNLFGLHKNNYIVFEETGHSSELYNEGKKYKVIDIIDDTTFIIQGEASPDVEHKTVKWCLSKDDVSPHDIFEMYKGTDEDRAVIAKYCIQDCNLVHHILQKVDVLTEFTEMANICSVPFEYLVLRGQGIKLFSFISKECRRKDTLIPVLDKKNDGGYEGAIVLKPKCGLYLNEPVACVDYSSLYPSSMISDNISHDSKVWTKEYDLDGNLLKEWGVKDKDGNYVYDNLEGYEYVNITYDTYAYKKRIVGTTADGSPRYSKDEKIKVGYKTCRWVQFKEGHAILPSILKKLLSARKHTRTIAKHKKIELNDGTIYYGIIKYEDDEKIFINIDKGKEKIMKKSIRLIEDRYNDFMKNVLDKRQLAIKVTANSVYGQCGAVTSSFYEKDVAASTTATGRKLLNYAKNVVEDVYGNKICETSYGKVHSHAEYIYGDSVVGDTPILIKHRGKVYLKRIDEICMDWKPYEGFKLNDTKIGNRREKEQSILRGGKYYVWTSTGWSRLRRVIRHKCNKSIYRIRTLDSVVDVTEDHSLLDKHKRKVKPEELRLGFTELLENRYPKYISKSSNKEILSYYACSSKLECAKLVNWLHMKGISFHISISKIMGREIYEIYRSTQTYTTIVQEVKKIHTNYNDFVYDIETKDGTFNVGFPLIVKNTDSVFMSFKLTDLSGKPIVGKEALKHTIELGKQVGTLATKFLKPPHDLEYEKTFMPFCLLSKKRYVGMLYEDDPDRCYRKSMGIVLKRRDNAPIVKDIYGGIIDILMKNNSLEKAVEFTRSSLNNLVSGKVPINKLIITKSLREHYKNPKQIAHKVLADRMAERDPGNKPSVGDRIPFVYIETKRKKNVLQGDKVEHPDYIKKHNLTPDYGFYITNQIMKPIQQIFELVLEDIPNYNKKHHNEIENKLNKYTGDKYEEKRQELRNRKVKELIFDEILIKNNHRKTGQTTFKSLKKVVNIKPQYKVKSASSKKQSSLDKFFV